MKGVSILRAVGLSAMLLLVGVSAASAQGNGNGNEVSSQAQVKNEVPRVLAIEFPGMDEDPGQPGVQVSPRPNGQVEVRILGRAEDRNGWQDLRYGEFQVFDPRGTRIVQGLEAAAQPEGQAMRRAFEASFPLAYHDSPGTYVVRFEVKDRANAAAEFESTFELAELLAISLGSSAVSFGALSPGQNTDNDPSRVVVRNAGNVELHLRVGASPLETPQRDAAIAPDRIYYSPAGDMSGKRGLSESGFTDTSTRLPPGPSSTLDAFFSIHVPTGEEQYIPADTYTGTITLGAVSS